MLKLKSLFNARDVIEHITQCNHLPLPGKTIALFPHGIDYTFRYLAHADGKGTSNAGGR